MFVGYPRSGHSLIGSLLDAHPEVMLAHELNALRYIEAGYRRDQLFWLILENNAAFTDRGRSWGRYTYAVPDQWQGRYERLRIIGDKKGGGSSVKLRKRPQLLDRLRKVVGKEVVAVHVMRNPFDNIAAISLRSHSTLERCAERYFSMCETIQAVKQRTDTIRVIDVRHEDLIADPRACLRQLCSDLGLQAESNYLDACAGVVFQRPHQSRSEVSWDDKVVSFVERRQAEFGYLAGYAFDQ